MNSSILFSTGFCQPKIWRCHFQHSAKIKCECQDFTHWNSFASDNKHSINIQNYDNGIKCTRDKSHLIHLSFRPNKPQQLTTHFNNCLVAGFRSTQLYIKIRYLWNWHIIFAFSSNTEQSKGTNATRFYRW